MGFLDVGSSREDRLQESRAESRGNETVKRLFCWSVWAMARPRNQGRHIGGLKAEGEAKQFRS